MRLAVLAFVSLPVAVHAQETTITIPTEPVAQTQTCPEGMVWNEGANACAMPNQSQTTAVGGHSCGGGMAAREEMS